MPWRHTCPRRPRHQYPGGNSTIVFDLDNDILVLDVDNLQASDFLFA